ncbi:MAG: fused response regulator/phosphatase [Alphaproteobacteria bacterium]|nr:fused response regulator/phosphatase [Alphaproteobacteria bacterium]
MIKKLTDRELMAASRILLVDDDAFQRMVIRQIVTDSGCLHIEEASDGKAALELIRTWNPDLVFLDENMPVMGGLEVCKAMQREDLYRDTIVIMQTAVDKAEFKAQAFDAGVTDFITKPLHAREVISRVKAHLGRKLLKEEIEKDYQEIQADLKEAVVLQGILLPQKGLLREIRYSQGLDIAQYYYPSSGLGGDYLAVRKLSDSKTLLLIADISGHGITAALYTFVLHTILEAQPLHELMPGEIMKRLNEKLYSLMAVGKFATMFIGVVDVAASLMEYAAAASPDPLLFSNGTVTRLKTRGFLLGATLKGEYETCSCPFRKGDVLCLYSDAMVETPDSQGKTLSGDELADHLTSCLSEQAIDILHGTLSKLLVEYDKAPADDLSILICKHV